MLANFSIRQRVTAIIIATIVLLSLSGFFTYQAVTPIQTSWDEYQTQAAERQHLLLVMKDHFGYGGMIHNFKNYVLRGQDKFLQRITNNYQELTNSIQSYRQLEGITTSEKNALVAIETVAKSYHDNASLVAKEYGIGKSARQIDALVKINDKPALDGFDALDKHYQEMTQAVSNLINEEINDTQTFAILGAIVVALAVSAALSWLYTSVIPPLQVLNRTMDEIAHGDGDLSVRLNESRRDELGMLSKSFNLFISKLEEIIIEQKHVIEEVSASAAQLNEISHSNKQLQQVQQGHTDQLATAVEEMTAAVSEVAQNASFASNSTSEAGTTAGHGSKAVNDTVSQIEDIHRHLTEASTVVHEVNDASDQIGQVLNVISEIAEQTNLLALNAAIEAARAGDTGRGFAVVADEVRGLAQRTSSSLGDIRKIIEQLQTGAQSAVLTMERGVNEADAGREVAKKAGASIGEIVTKINVICDMNMQIATATEEQSAVAEDMNQNVHNISSMSGATLSSSEKIAQQSERLADLASNLHRLVGNFKTSHD